MAKPVLDIKNLKVEVEGKEILHGINLHIEGGEIHAIMGPNGTGKSTLASALMGHPRYTITAGTVTLDGADLLSMSVDERARAGIFLGMQYPAEVPGVTNTDFLRSAVNAKRNCTVGFMDFRKELITALNELEMRKDLPDRYLNEGFSGGEKKRNEILQMKLLRPSIAILDEIDSGLDIDALRIVGQNITDMFKKRGEEMAVLMITHYQRLLDYVHPDFVHVIIDGKIVHTGDAALALRLEAEGYDWLKQELGIEINANEAQDASGAGQVVTDVVGGSAASTVSSASAAGVANDLDALFK